MRAVVLTEEAQIRLDERPTPEVESRSVLLQVNACGICGTDLHAPASVGLFVPNVVLGHEFSGTVIDAGTAVHGFTPGDEVVVNPIALACGECDACRRGLSNQCSVAFTQTCGVTRDGGMAEFVALDYRHLHRVPGELDVRTAAWTEPLGVAVRAVAHGHLRPGSGVAIVGAGAIGQLILQVALAAGAGETLVVETSAFRREIAERCGATNAIAPDDATDVDRLFDLVFDCTGAPEAFPTTLSLVAPGGRVVVLGSYTSPITLNPHATPTREASIVFSMVYRDDAEFAAALGLLARGVINVDALTTSFLPISRHEEAFALLRNADEAVKILLDPTLD